MKYLVKFSTAGSSKIHKKNYLRSEIEHQMCHFLNPFSKEYIYSFSYKKEFVNSSNAAMSIPPNVLSHLKVLLGIEYLI